MNAIPYLNGRPLERERAVAIYERLTSRRWVNWDENSERSRANGMPVQAEACLRQAAEQEDAVRGVASAYLAEVKGLLGLTDDAIAFRPIEPDAASLETSNREA